MAGRVPPIDHARGSAIAPHDRWRDPLRQGSGQGAFTMSHRPVHSPSRNLSDRWLPVDVVLQVVVACLAIEIAGFIIGGFLATPRGVRQFSKPRLWSSPCRAEPCSATWVWAAEA